MGHRHVRNSLVAGLSGVGQARHSVRRHLCVEVDTYDAAIRSFCPGYEEMLGVLAAAVARSGALRVLDLGAGSGALSEAILQASDRVTVQLLDQDMDMLGHARVRLARFVDRATFTEGSFLDVLPKCDAAVASLSLHHVRTLGAKRELYGRIHDSLAAGGIFLSGDAAVPGAGAARDAAIRAWTNHMGTCGIDTEGARANLAAWSREDTYFSLRQELDALERAGFDADCIWRCGPMAVVAGWKA